MKKLSNYLVPFAFILLLGCTQKSCKKNDPFIPLPEVKITSVNPSSGWEGDTVVITGTFGNSLIEEVKLGGQSVDSIITATSTQITVIVPRGYMSGPVKVTISRRDVTGGYHAKSGVGPVFTYVRPTKVTITSISPDTAHVGDTITILGKNFLSDKLKNKVLFGDQQAKIINRPDGARLEVIVPKDTGTVPVIVSVLQEDNTTKSDTALFTYISDAAPSGGVMVSTLAGKGGTGDVGYVDGPGSTARFNNPADVVVDKQGNIYVADEGNHRIRKITPAGVVSTFAGNGIAGSVDGNSSSAEFHDPFRLAVDASGNIYVTDGWKLRKITTNGVVSTIAGSTQATSIKVSPDGPAATAKFYSLTGVAVDASGNIYIGDVTRLCKISSSGVVSTLAGGGTGGFADGAGSAAKFWSVNQMSIDDQGNIYAADGGGAIRKITPAGIVSTLAGGGYGIGFKKGSGFPENFFPDGLTIDKDGNIYVCGSNNAAIEKVSSSGNGSVVAGDLSDGGYVDGAAAAARFNEPYGLAVDAKGNIYVADYNNQCIRKITFK